MKEIKSLRKQREKHFIKSDGTFLAKVYDHDIHILKNGKYEDINNNLINKNDYFTNKENFFHINFFKNIKKELLNLTNKNYKLKIDLIDKNKLDFKIENNSIYYLDILNNIDLRYEIINNVVKEEIILKNKNTLPDNITFKIDTNLNIEKQNDLILLKDNFDIIYKIEKPYFIDGNKNINDNLNYDLEEKNGIYYLTINLDKTYLQDNNTIFPVIIDPTLIVNSKSNIYDTYIYPGDTNITRYNTDVLKVGADSSKKYRTLLKFDLPVIGTGSIVTDAKCYLYSHEDDVKTNYEQELIDVHEITSSWTEDSASWNTMNDKYNTRIEDYFIGERTTIYNNTYNLQTSIFNITNLVKRWYADKENYGIMLKKHDETYSTSHSVNMFYSKNHNLTSVDPRPILEITYVNQNGLEEYMSYEKIPLTDASCYVNRYNGNMTASFNLNNTINSKFPVSLSLIYNTNDVILNNNYGYGISYKLNLHQELKEVVIDSNNYLEYLDADGTYHYFINHEGSYVDLDGLGINITKENDIYYLKDKTGNKMKFIKNNTTWYLKEIYNTKEDKIEISYDSSNRIIKIVDESNKEINLIYEIDKTTITSNTKTTIINYTNGKITSIITKNGTTNITYNDRNLIDEITDVSGKGIKFTYYNPIPYKVSNYYEIGLDNTIGKYLNFQYGFNSTMVIDNKNRYKTYTFNNNGNLMGITNLDSNQDIDNGYGFKSDYYESLGDINYSNYNNKLSNYIEPIRYINNYLTNSSFEDSFSIFDLSDTVIRSDECSNTGIYSLKVISSGTKNINYNLDVSKGNYYTFSLYLKNNCNMKISLSYTNNNNEVIKKTTDIGVNNDFYRYDVTIDYTEDSSSNLRIDIDLENVGICYIDDIQLEKGLVANYYNLIDNSNFKNGLTNWNFSCILNGTYDTEALSNDEIVTLENGCRAFKINSDPTLSKELKKTFNISGQEGDCYNLSFWYKNEGINPSGGVESTNRFLILFHYVDLETGRGAPTYDLVIHNNNWQFVSIPFVAEKEYTSFDVIVVSSGNANSLYVSNFSLYKDIEANSFFYDSTTGNLIKAKDKDGTITNMKYDSNNKLLNMATTSGNNFKFEYDNNTKDLLLQGLSKNGIANKIVYDNNGNPIKTIIKNVYFDEFNPNSKYYIRLKGCEKYLKLLKYSFTLEENSCSYDKYEFEKEEDYYKIKSVKANKYLKLSPYSNNLVLDTPSLFKLISCSNGSYAFNIKDTNRYLAYKDNKLSFIEITNSDYDFDNDNDIQFFIENSENNLYIESSATYDNDKNIIKDITDSLSNKTYYNIDNNGLLKDTTDSLNNKISYDYNDKELITKVEKDGISVDYIYNDSNILNKIKTENKEYNITYDEFLNTKEIKVGYNTLVTNNYESNNGNLISQVYGNGSIISYSYDDFDRLSKKIKQNDTINYYYNNLGSIGKILSYDDVYKYNYDFARRLSSFSINNFKVDYDYDLNSNVIKKIYQLNDSKEINYSYNGDDLLTELSFDNNNINYSYDYLGRIKEKNINNFKTEYSYLTNGNKTLNKVELVKISSDEYRYKYDNMYNITHIYKNDTLINKYTYDNYYELIQDDNYLLNKTIRYTYDNEGNIINKKEYELNTYNLLNKNSYYYEDINWKDKLTKFNNEEITYDNIGNPMTIGNKTLSWINGRELNSYIDNSKNLNVSYKYNKDGIRKEKIVNNEIIRYHTEQNMVIFEEKGNNVIYYIRDEKGNLEGFKYNNTLYYYIKNIQNDIIGILDSNLNEIATYEYDSYGNVLSIKDSNGNEITDKTNIAIINPYRYRSYYYDEETKLYYLNSRYYNPLWGRFINADKYISTDTGLLGYNMYSYCNNNPIMYIDADGHAILFGMLTFMLGFETLFLANAIYRNIKAKKEINEVQKQKAPDRTKEFNVKLNQSAKNIKEEVGQVPIVRLYEFAQVTKSYSKYDLKRQGEWQETIMYNGIVMEPQDIGNFHLGYIGRAAGFNIDTLTMGAGIYQLYEHWNKSITYMNCLTFSTCDDPRDSYFIRLGALAYDENN